MDVVVERRIAAAPARVAAIMFEPENDPRWIGGAKAVERLTPGPIGPGSRVRREGGFLGRRFAWVTEVVSHEPGRSLDMAFVEGPMKGGVSYEVRPEGEGAVACIHNHGGASFEVPGMAWFLKRSVAKDLDRLAALAEG